ncbi:MAG: hypothetical protein E7661_06045 [Ruminococcaceae bacterium]|nr:hypothetical protein [Oscillospiraceae bacterium]
MNTYTFQKARRIFCPLSGAEAAERNKEAVNHYCFYTKIELDEDFSDAVFALTGRNMYRLYVNGEIVMHGPARTAHGYCRVDEVDISPFLTEGENYLAVEVMVYGDVYNRYSNDCTLESGMFIGEVRVNDEVVCATGVDPWQVGRLKARAPHTQRISHSREAAEVYFLDDEFYGWTVGRADFAEAALMDESDAPTYLTHEALQPTLEEHPITQLVEYGSCFIDKDKPLTTLFYEKNSPYYAALPEHPLEDCRRTVERAFHGVSVLRSRAGSLFLDGEGDKFVLFDGGESRVGFVGIEFSCDHDGVVDIVHSELLNPDGSIPYYHDVVTRLHVNGKRPRHAFVTMEPCLARYIKIYFRGTGDVTLRGLSILDYAYPDEMRSGFQCSDDNINRLYNAAKKTLILNTMDIFMDCPERERGGWLCDSLWTARAAQMMLSDTRVEKEFIENFLLTPSDGMFHAFFPEAYPGNKPNFKEMTGITTWSFWLMCEFVEYVERTGDYAFRDEYADRVASFVKGSLDFIGQSGLLENLPWLFIDWSLSNHGEYQQPISTPANALYAYMMVKLGRLYQKEEWISRGAHIRRTLWEAILAESEMGLETLTTFPDSFEMGTDGKLHGRGKTSESGMATALWAGLFLPGQAPLMDDFVINRMGPAPHFASDPNIGKSQLFIGLCIRLDLLARFGAYDKMYEDMLAIYEPQLREGPGTLWENQIIDTSSRCHGFTAHAGVHLMRDVLGLGLPEYGQDGSKRMTIAPHICGLRWARGTVELDEGLVSVFWKYDGKSFTLQASVPSGYEVDVILPREAKALDEGMVDVQISTHG